MKETPPQPIAGEDWVVRYEQLRNDSLSRAASCGCGLIVFLREGMTAWMRASSGALVTPAPALAKKSLLPWNTVSSLPCDLRSEAAVILAGILLSYPTEATLCKAT
jgi:hypothetical protein